MFPSEEGFPDGSSLYPPILRFVFISFKPPLAFYFFDNLALLSVHAPLII